jgi:thiamine-phosphate pyrophosphorylase
MTPAPPPLVALTPGELEGARAVEGLVDAARRAFSAGLPGLMLREPKLDDRNFTEVAGRLVELAHDFGGRWLGVHDRVHVALATGADGVHLGFRSMTPGAVRELVGEGLTVGFSAHAGDDEQAFKGADYITFGPVRETPSKGGWLEPTGFEGLGEAAARTSVPVHALGGLRPEDVSLALNAGAAGVWVLSGILCAEDVGAATAAYLAAVVAEEGA